jgi:hypothetical protein
MLRIISLIFVATLFSGCATPPKLYKVESVYVCAAEECGLAAQRYGAEQMLTGLQRLLAANDGQEFKVCDSDPKNRACLSQSICHYTQTGLIPAMTCMRSGMLTNPLFDNAEKRINFQFQPHRSIDGIPVPCEAHMVSVTAHSIDEIAWEDEPFICKGIARNSFSFAIESVDFDRGIVGGYWNHSVLTAGGGGGSGYGVFMFPKAMPRDENWLTLTLKK